MSTNRDGLNESDEMALEVLRSRFKVDLDCTPSKKATKKATKTKFSKPKGYNSTQDTHVLWKKNYMIVRKMCKIIAQYSLLEESGDSDRLPWAEFVGHVAHNCKYLPFGKRLSYPMLVQMATGFKDEQMATVAKSVHKFVMNTRSDRVKKNLPEWKIDLLNELEFDILK
mmetsp:Transcript_20690/g.32383  ORF Transcript_20690/g.32383 Transcript_20690/m.32383 type:complete len:169 (-) Transcript_20690:103-609(-)